MIIKFIQSTKRRNEQMGESRNIIEEYQKSDYERRLYLFLSYRSYREEFMAIDQEERAGSRKKKATARTPLPRLHPQASRGFLWRRVN
jgi:hypothetical protein